MMYESDYLMHHGIKGQKWGVENGPPYPLNPQRDYSKAEQKANAKDVIKRYKKYNSNNPSNDSYVGDNKNIKLSIEKLSNDKTKYYDSLEEYSKARNEFYSNPNRTTFFNLAKAIDNANELESNYFKKCLEETNNLVGEYGNKKVGGQFYNNNVKSIVYQVIKDDDMSGTKYDAHRNLKNETFEDLEKYYKERKQNI